MNELVLGDLGGAVFAGTAIILLQLRYRLGLVFAGLVIVESVADAIAGIYVRSTEPPRADATGVWWLVFVFFAPTIIVSLPLIAWQLYARWGGPLSDADPVTIRKKHIDDPNEAASFSPSAGLESRE